MGTSKRMRRFGDVSIRMVEPTGKRNQEVPEIVSDAFLDAYHGESWNADATARVELNQTHRVR